MSVGVGLRGVSRKVVTTMPHVKLNGFVVLIARAMSMVVKKFERR